MKSLLTLAMFMMFSSSALAKSGFSAGVYNMDTSDGISMLTKEIKYDRHMRDLSWPYKEEEPSLFDYGFGITSIDGFDNRDDFDSLHVKGYLAKQWEEFSAKFSLGNHQLENSAEKSLNSYSLLLQKKFSEIALLELLYGYDWAYKHLILPGSTKNFIKVHDTQVSALISPTASFRIPVKMINSSFTDGNDRNKGEASFLYGSSWPLWIWGGYGFQYMRNSKKSLDYWSPTKLFSHFLQFEVSKTFKEVWSLNFGGSYSFIKEEENDWAQSNYLSFGVDYGNRNSLLISLNYSRVEAIQNSNTWTMNEASLSMSYLF